MHEKRLFLAIFVSLLILLIYNTFIMPPPKKKLQSQTIDTQEVKTDFVQEDSGQEVLPASEKPSLSSEEPEVSAEVPQEEELISLENEVLRLGISQKTGFIREVYLKNYSEKLSFENILYLPSLSGDITSFNAIEKGYRLQSPEAEITYVFKSPEVIEFLIKFNTPLSAGSMLVFSKPPEEIGIDERFSEFFYYQEGKVLRKSPSSLVKAGVYNPEWFGIRNRYFCLIFQTQPKLFLSANKDNKTINIMGKYPSVSSFEGSIFIGPQSKEILTSYGYQDVVYYGKFGAISSVIMNILQKLQSILGNWGFSIILLSIGIYLILLPFTAASTKSMLKMQKLQPQIEELKEQYKDNSQKLNKEIMKLYKESRVNPLGGCLPLFLQLPVFIGLYQAILRSIELKGASFLWIKDLSVPDRTLPLGFELPFLGSYLNILPIFMAILMAFQQRLTQPGAGQSEQQRMMMVFFPIFFGFIFYNFPSGLVLYWLTNSILTFIYQYRLKKVSAARQE